MSLNDRAGRALSRIPSVFLRLILSYVVLVTLVAATVSGVSYAYFKSVYNRELDRFHELYLKNIEKELSGQVVDAAKLVYMELNSILSQREGNLFSPEARLPEEASKIYSTYRALDDLVARNYDRIEAVNIYYVQAGILVSSSGFVPEGSSVLQGDGRAWLAELAARGSRSAWTVFERPAYLGIPAMTLFRSLRCFPILSSPEDCSAVICVDFRAEALRGIIARLSPQEGGLTTLMAPDSPDYIGSQAGADADAETEAALRGAVAAGGGEPLSRVVSLKGRPSLLSVLPLSDSGWSLVNLVQASRLYRKGEGIRLAVLAICIIAIGLGAIIAAFIATGIYNPLDRLLQKFRTLFGVPLPEPAFRRDEYRVIDDALSGISTRMDELQAIVEANRPIIAHELVLRFLEGERMEAEELRDTLDLLGKTELPSRLRAFLLTIVPEGGGRSGGAGEEAPVLKYRIAGELERERGCVLASPLSGDRVGLVAGAEEGSEEDRRARPGELVAFVKERTGATVRAAAGAVVSRPEELTDSFAVARELAEYAFLFPEQGVLADRPDLLGRTGRSAAPEKDFAGIFAACLRSRDGPRLKSLLERYRLRAREGDCRIRACRSELEDLGQAVAEFARELRHPGHPLLGRSISELLAESKSIDAFLDELAGIAAEICATADDPQARRSALLVARIKSHIEGNLSGELSLDRVGEAVAVSPGYMGKIFKEETGRSFVSYVTEVRLTEAARLLVESRESVQDIGKKAGFNTSAYFIRLFKGRYGQTPLDFRRSKASR